MRALGAALPTMDTHASIDPSWRYYPETILELGEEGQVCFDLRISVTEAVLASIRQLGFHSAFGIITAFNPRGSSVSFEENLRRSSELERTIAGLRGSWMKATGTSPDGAHREPGLAVELPQSYVRSLAVQFQQSAFFWFDGEVFWIVGAIVDSAPLRLPVTPDPGRAMVGFH